MSTTTAPDIAAIVRQVIAELTAPGAPAAPKSPAAAARTAAGSYEGANGVFSSVDEAVAAATEAFQDRKSVG